MEQGQDNSEALANLLLDSLNFQLERGVTVLYKKLLYILDDIKFQNEEMLKKLAKDMEDEDLPRLVEINYMTEGFYKHIRKKILDAGNDTQREIKNTIDEHKKVKHLI